MSGFRSLNFLKLLLLGLGLGILAWVLKTSDLDRLLETEFDIGKGVFVLLAAYPFICFWDVWGWMQVFEPSDRRAVRFRDLYVIRMACEAVNSITPFVDVGGELIKVPLASDRFKLSKRKVLATVIIERTALFFSEIIFWSAGILPALVFLPIGGYWRVVFVVTAVISLGLAWVLVVLQKRGLFFGFLHWFERFAFGKDFFQKLNVPLKDVDAHMIGFYKAKDGRWPATLCLHGLGWLAGGLEMYGIFWVLGTPVTVFEAIMVEALLQIIRTASFFIPGNLGAQEGGLMWVAQWMGLHPSLGVLVSLVKRLRQVIWTAIGFGLLWILDRQKLMAALKSDTGPLQPAS